jgi:glutaconate CoA-transferase subunit A
VDGFAGAHPNACILPHWTVSAIAVVPGGAFPSYAQGYYRRSNAFYRSWDAVSRERETFLAWLEREVRRAGPEAFAVHATRVA